MNQPSQVNGKALAGITYAIGGVVYAMSTPEPTTGKRERRPVAGATVELRDHARATKSDQDGRFRFANLAAGAYTLAVTASDGSVGERVIQVPPTYDVEVQAPAAVAQPLLTITPDDPPAPPPAATAETSVATAAAADKALEATKRSRPKKKTETSS